MQFTVEFFTSSGREGEADTTLFDLRFIYVTSMIYLASCSPLARSSLTRLTAVRAQLLGDIAGEIAQESHLCISPAVDASLESYVL